MRTHPIVDRPDWRASSRRRRHVTLFQALQTYANTVTILFVEVKGNSRSDSQTSRRAGWDLGYQIQTQADGGLNHIRLPHETGVAA